MCGVGGGITRKVDGLLPQLGHRAIIAVMNSHSISDEFPSAVTDASERHGFVIVKVSMVDDARNKSIVKCKLALSHRKA